MARFDVTVQNTGSVVLVRPNTEEAREWLRDNVADATWWGGALVASRNMVGALLDGLVEEGFTVTH